MTRPLKPDPHWLRPHIRDIDLLDVLNALEPTEIHILTDVMIGEYGRGPEHVVNDLYAYHGTRDLLPEPQVKWARHYLQSLHRRHGCLEFGFLMDEYQYGLQGRGYWISSFGERVRYQIEQGYFND